MDTVRYRYGTVRGGEGDQAQHDMEIVTRQDAADDLDAENSDDDSDDSQDDALE